MLCKGLNKKKWSWLLFLLVNIAVPLIVILGILIANSTSYDDVGVVWLISFLFIVTPLIFGLEFLITNKLRYYISADLIVISIFTVGCIQIRNMSSMVGEENVFNIVVLMSAGIMMIIAVLIIMLIEVIVSFIIKYKLRHEMTCIETESGIDE